MPQKLDPEMVKQNGIFCGKDRPGRKRILSLRAEDLHRLYWDERLVPSRIAKIYDVCVNTIYNEMKRHGIPRRAQGGKGDGDFDPEMVKHLYYHENLKPTQIAERIGAHRSSVYRIMKQVGIPRRKDGSGRKRILSLRTEDLHRLYWDERLHPSQIAKIHNVSASTIYNELDRHGIPRRAQGFQKGNLEWQKRRAK